MHADSDATTNSVTYSLANSAGGRFAIDSNTGVVTVASAIDRETAASYDIAVRATSTDGSTADQVVTVNINDVDEFDVTTPVDVDATTNEVAENSVVGTVVGPESFCCGCRCDDEQGDIRVGKFARAAALQSTRIRAWSRSLVGSIAKPQLPTKHYGSRDVGRWFDGRSSLHHQYQ